MNTSKKYKCNQFKDDVENCYPPLNDNPLKRCPINREDIFNMKEGCKKGIISIDWILYIKYVKVLKEEFIEL